MRNGKARGQAKSTPFYNQAVLQYKAEVACSKGDAVQCAGEKNFSESTSTKRVSNTARVDPGSNSPDAMNLSMCPWQQSADDLAKSIKLQALELQPKLQFKYIVEEALVFFWSSAMLAW